MTSRSCKLAILVFSLFAFSMAAYPGGSFSGNAFAQSSNSTATAGNSTAVAEPEIKINAGFATFSYGVVSVGVTIENAIPDQTEIEIEFYNPDGELEGTESQPISIQNGTGMTGCYCFGIERQYVEENYKVTVIYGGYSETEIMEPFSSTYPQPPTISFHAADQEDDYEIHIGGRVSGGISGEQVNVEVLSEDGGSSLLNKTVDSNTKAIFEVFLRGSEVQDLPTGTYRVVATHVATGVTGETTLDYDNPGSQEEPEPEPVPEPEQPEAPQTDDTESDEQDDEEQEDSQPDGTIRSPFVFDDGDESDGEVTPTSTAGGSTSVAQADENTLVINGTLASYYILDNATETAGMSELYILSGNWSMTVNSTAVSDFAANFTIVRADGAVRNTYSIANFSPVNSSGVQLGSDSIVLASTADIQKGGNATAVNLIVTIEKFNVIKIEFGDDLSRPTGRPIYGVVDSLATVNDGELSIVPR